MKFEEYEKIINDLVSDPDTMLVKVDGLKEAIKTDITSLESLTAEKSDLETRIRTLQDTNMRLFLSVTDGSVPENDEPSEEEKVADMDFEEYMAYVKSTEVN